MIDSLRKKIFLTDWNIGFVDDSLDTIVASKEELNIHWMKHNYRDRWFADPFILFVDECYIKVLVEEFYRPINRGRIALLTIRREDYMLIDNKTVLQEKTHLSFPLIVRKENGKVYIIPENGESKELKIYELDVTRGKCEYIRSFFEGFLADAVFVNINGKKYMTATTLPEPNGKELNIYMKNGNRWILNETVVFDSNIARNAGDWFEVDGQLYRPAQDCNGGYGVAMYIQRVNVVGDISFENVRKIVPTSKRYHLGTHTLNHYDGVTVVDGYGYKHWLTRLYATCKK